MREMMSSRGVGVRVRKMVEISNFSMTPHILGLTYCFLSNESSELTGISTNVEVNVQKLQALEKLHPGSLGVYAKTVTKTLDICVSQPDSDNGTKI
ncbi:hypothetical protein MKW98_011492 [Papaver atlanticum]|uniref:Uncharacterized protein n=1 Tax=Papaver atlanticum TaxID=357466 RepID=A0AAD4SMW1_9MAGN|nr:hypothetical protein MKW98_011492 [Papaver atlanticum]